MNYSCTVLPVIEIECKNTRNFNFFFANYNIIYLMKKKIVNDNRKMYFNC